MSGSATTLSLATLMHVRTTQAQPMQEYSRGNSWCQPVDENCPLFCLDNEQVSSGPDVRSTRPVAKRDNMEDAFLFRTGYQVQYGSDGEELSGSGPSRCA